jgi:hypothetical protein
MLPLAFIFSSLGLRYGLQLFFSSSLYATMQSSYTIVKVLWGQYKTHSC